MGWSTIEKEEEYIYVEPLEKESLGKQRRTISRVSSELSPWRILGGLC
jgi:hypothetical protein